MQKRPLGQEMLTGEGLAHALCGARNVAQAQDNAAAGRIALGAEDVETLNPVLGEYADTLNGISGIRNRKT